MSMLTAVPFASRIVGRHGREIIARDRARAQKILAGHGAHGPHGVRELRKSRHHGHHGSSSGGTASDPPAANGQTVDVTDAGVTYTASVGVGNPATQYTLLIDTGKSPCVIVLFAKLMIGYQAAPIHGSGPTRSMSRPVQARAPANKWYVNSESYIFWACFSSFYSESQLWFRIVLRD